MTETNEGSGVEAAERFQRLRRRRLLVLTSLFLALQFVFPSGSGDNPGLPLAGEIKLPAFLVSAVALLVMMSVPGGVLILRKQRAAFNDELTRRHRAGGYVGGFLTALATAAVMYFQSMVQTVTAREALHVVITLSVAVTVLVFVVLEERAERAG